MSVKPIPDGYRTVTPYLVVDNGTEAMEFYKRAFGAQEVMRMAGPGGKLAHAELRIGDSMIMLGDEMPGSLKSAKSLGGSPVGVFLYVENVDQAFERAVKAGAKAEMQPTDMFWGDRYGKLKDPFGHSWSMATHKEDVAPEEMQKRMKQAMAQMGQPAQHASS
jgi:PhnB protein